MLGPTLWSGTPYGNRTALSDFAGTLELWFRGLADEIFDLTGDTITVLPIGARFGTPESLEAVQAMCVRAAIALAIDNPPNLTDFDLGVESEFGSYMFSLSNVGETLRVAAGLP